MAADSNTKLFASVAAVTDPALELNTCKLPSGLSVPMPTLPVFLKRIISDVVVAPSALKTKSLLATPLSISV